MNAAPAPPADPLSQSSVPGGLRNKIRYWRSVLPGSRRDYILLTLVVIDVAFIMTATPFAALLPREVTLGALAFDIFVAALWGAYFLQRLFREKDRLAYARTHWYEVVGLLPLQPLRIFLLMRGVRLAIAFYKIGKSEQRVSRLLTREFTFRFRDVIVDTIADAVFKRSLERVEEVMRSLDYVTLAHDIMTARATELRSVVGEAVQQKSMVGELKKIPLMGGFADRLGDDIGQVVVEVLETRVLGDIMKDITGGILLAMHTRLKQLEVERIVTPSTAGDPPIYDTDETGRTAGLNATGAG
jgi:hypothetical protein